MSKSIKPRRKHDSHERYEKALRDLQIEFVKLQEHIIKHKHKVLVIFEGRDASGTDGTIKRIVEHPSPRETRVVALGKPSDRDGTSWYFRRYVSHLPRCAGVALFNRIWYNQAGVERIMEFCTDREYERFMNDVLPFEHMLIGSGISDSEILPRQWQEGAEAATERQARHDPLKQCKTSPIGEVAVKHWDDYTEARDQMLARTSSPLSPRIVVRADDKHLAQLNVIRDLLARLACPQTEKHLAIPDLDVVFPYDKAHCAGLPAT